METLGGILAQILNFGQKKSHSQMKGNGFETYDFFIASFTPSRMANAAHHTHLHHTVWHDVSMLEHESVIVREGHCDKF
jgi:hypothetical protein